MKRILPILMSLVLVFSLFAVSVFAAESYSFVYDSDSGYYVTDSIPSFGFYSFHTDIDLPEIGLSGTFSSLPSLLDFESVDFVGFFFVPDLGINLVLRYDPSLGAVLGYFEDGNFVSVSDLVSSFSLIPESECFVVPCVGTTLHVPEGTYSYDIYWPEIDVYSVWHSSSPVDLSYSFCEYGDGFQFISAFIMPGYSNPSSLFLTRDAEGSRLYFLSEGALIPFPGTVVFYPAVESPSPVGPSLSGVVDSGVMSGVLDQVVSLLPVVLVTIITFFATRKGIAFLRGFLAGS